MRTRLRILVLVLLAATAAALVVAREGTTTAAAAPSPPKVTVIGDSVLTGVFWYSQPTAILEQGLDVRLQVAVCRRLTGTSCTFEGVTPPNLLQLVASLGPQLGPTAVVEMGYNDHESTFAQGVEASVQALLRAGVTRIVWVSLREARHSLVAMNDMLAAAARRHPQLTIADWNRYSRSHPDWFQNDGIHLEQAGGIAMATFLHDAIMRALRTPLPIEVTPARLPAARVGHVYLGRLTATGGTAPYRFRLASGALPKGLALRSNGRIFGTPTKPLRARFVVRAQDAKGRTAAASESLVVTR